jgi:hypothetical protein
MIRIEAIAAAAKPVLLSGYAYETIPNKPIVAGQKSGSDTQDKQIAPQAGTLGHLALGAAGKD